MSVRKLGSCKATTPMLITSVDLATDVTGVLPGANGGTGTGTYTNGQLLIGQTTGNTLAKAVMSGDVTMDQTGLTAIGAGKVTLGQQANMATASLVYRKTAGAGAPEVNSLATLKTDLGLTGTNSGDETALSMLKYGGLD